ncbi:hypothetical protein COE53_11700 [Bacillus sp. AFS029533]|nr:hypothetical protein COE53_11700 [Bacillus sp. AFS029533]
MDMIIKEINELFLTLNFNKIVINDIENFEFNGEYYMLTNSGSNYYLECVCIIIRRSYEDLEAYSSKLYSFDELKVNIKNDITKLLFK